MRVIFDHQCFQDQAEGGISRYVVNLVAALRELPGVDVNGWGGLHQGSAPDLFGGRRVEGRWLEGMGMAHRLARMCNTLGFAAWARGLRAEVYHATYYRCLHVPRRLARVVTAHDCIHERFPEMGGAEVMLKQAVFARADHIICISKSTRDDVIRFYGVPEDKLSVVYHGAGLVPNGRGGEVTGVADAGARHNECPYVLYVGRRNGYKNFNVLRALWAADQGLRDVCELVCVGGENGDSMEFGSKVRHVVRASDSELRTLYAGAVALVYPSKYEGFGLPVLEAMRAGCPVVTTRGGAIPEVAGDAAYYCDPDNPREWREAILGLMRSAGARAEWSAKGHRQAAKFSWSDCATGTLAAYAKAVEARKQRRVGS